jgi:hypothetical protein
MRRREDNIQVSFMEITRDGVGLIHLVHVRDRWRAVVNTVMNLQDPQRPERSYG